ncbi:MAG: AMP-binding protein [Desulfobacteraceae bacterium]|nr:AMP-binding protein [Desulfobacteraceae bacterium]
MGLRDYTVYDFIRRNALVNPENDCIVFNDLRLTHRQYKQRCDRLAAGLKKRGVSCGDRLAVVAQNSDEFVILYGAAAKIGTIVVPVNWRFTGDEMAYVLRDTTPSWIFAGPGYRQAVTELKQDIGVKNFCTIGGGEVPEGWTPFDGLYDDKEQDDVFDDIDGNSGFVIIHTAAVQGRPRGAVLSQNNIFAISMQMIANEGFNEDSCHICILPLFHVAGLARFMAVMHAGGKNVILERFEPEKTLRLIDAEKGTTFFNFAPILKRLTDKYHELGRNFDLSGITRVGGLDHSENLEQFEKIAPNVEFASGFGQTEAMGVTWAPRRERPGSAGKPTLISRVALFDDNDKLVPVGEEGEICVRGPSVFQGYWGREDDTARTFRNGWHHTGDMGRFDEYGYLWYSRRKAEKELIKPGGENVYPAEVESAILEHPAIAETSVIGVPDKQWGEAIKAVCVLKPGQSADEQELIDFVASRIARYKKPRFVVFVDALAKTQKGEIDRQQVKKDHGGRF